MLKKHMAACLVATAFAAAPAFAQTQPAPSAPTDRPAAMGSGSTTSGSSAMQPSTAAPSSTMNKSSMSTTAPMQGQFVTQLQMNQLMASDLIGTRVISANNESIGDINDVIMDRDGKAVAAIVGVGGFLGIGEKDVAVPFASLEFATREQVSAMTKSDTKSDSTAATAPRTTGSTTTMGTAGTTTATGTASTKPSDNEPERVILRMTKAELQAAPTFDKDGDNRSTGTTAPATTAPATAPVTTPAPKP